MLRKWISCFALFTMVVLTYHPIAATPIPRLNLSRLVEDSTLIIVGSITSIKDADRRTLSWQGHSITVQNKLTELRVDRIIKGQRSGPRIIFEFVQPITPIGFAGVAVGQFGMFFLRIDSSTGGLTITDHYYPSVVAALASPKTSGSDFDRVVTEVGNVLVSLQTTVDEKVKAIAVLNKVDSESALQSLRLAANSNKTDVQLTAIAALLKRNDISKLDIAEKILLNPQSAVDEHFRSNLANSLNGIKDLAAIPSLSRLLRSSYVEVRRSAAYAIRHTSADESINPLMKALSDNDREVRYQAVMGLSEITGQNSWGPMVDRYNAEEQRYLAYWRNWASRR